MGRWLYTILGIGLLALYTVAELRGLEFRQTKKGYVPSTMRGKSGGSRSFWYSGYRGGK
ncbi:MAG TPA: hypothetical protein VF618_20990 [Thermoanaerobaculia bacterium]